MRLKFQVDRSLHLATPGVVHKQLRHSDPRITLTGYHKSSQLWAARGSLLEGSAFFR
jgi:hypothetical protein